MATCLGRYDDDGDDVNDSYDNDDGDDGDDNDDDDVDDNVNGDGNVMLDHDDD